MLSNFKLFDTIFQPKYTELKDLHYPPFEAEESELQEIVASHGADLVRIEGKIPRLQRVLKRLQTVRGGIKMLASSFKWRHIRSHNLPKSSSQGVPAPMAQSRQNMTSDLERLGGEIAEIQDTLEGFISGCDEVQHSLPAVELQLSSIHRVPPEIWTDIFLHCLPNDRYIRPDPSNAPMLLGQISKAWRSIALSVPYFWTSMAFHCQRPSSSCCSLLEMWLSRSGTIPLSLGISWFPLGSVETQGFDDHILTVIMPFSSRWQNLRLSVPDDAARKMLNADMPLLESIQLNVVLGLDMLNIPPSSVPRLRSISALSVYQNPRSFAIPWSQLTHLHLRYSLNVEGSVEILRECTSLLHCRLRVLSDAITPPAIPPIPVRHLQSLTIMTDIDEDVGPFLDSLDLPSLSSLEVTTQADVIAHHSRCWPKSQLLSLVSRSSCPLTRLCLKGMKTAEIELIYCVQEIPTLLDLIVLYSEQNVVTERVRGILGRNALILRQGPSR